MRSEKSFFYMSILTLFLTFNLLSCGGGGSGGVGGMLSPAKEITAFSFTVSNNAVLTEDALGIIDGTNITVLVPDGTDVTALIATFATTGISVTVDGTTQTSGTTANDFTSPVTYRVRAEDNTTRDYIVTVILVTKLTLNPVWDFYINRTYYTDTDPISVMGHGIDPHGTSASGSTGSATGTTGSPPRPYLNVFKLLYNFNIAALSGRTVHRAYVRVYLYDITGSPENAVLENIYYGDTDGFPSGLRNYANEFDGYIQSPSITDTAATNSVGWVEFDVTAKLRADVDADRKNSQFRLTHENNMDLLDFYCGWRMVDNTDNKPELVVLYD